VLRRESDEQPARRKPATRKASAPKPAPAPEQPSAPSPSDVTAVGDTVRVVQQALVARGYDPGPVNGRAGRQTEEAIRKFQQDRGLKKTGTIDYAVLETLNIVGPRIHAFQPPPGTTPGR
jgi:peptidoglycan hydrolase-like protein with peptidoglycan-binding domain